MTVPARTPVPPPARVLRRRTGTVVAGVAGGVADHLEVPVRRVRLVFALLAGLGGAGFLAYGALWVFCPPEPAGRGRVVDPREQRQGMAFAALGIGLALVLSAVGEQTVGWFVGPLGLALLGVAVVWREADDATPAGRARRRAGTWRPALVAGRMGALRVVAGALLVAGGIAVFLLGRLDLGQVQFALLAAAATLVGVVVLTVPWWMRLVRELGAERRERIRGQERAEIAAHLHDSVLQTLALIQRRAEEPASGTAETVREVRRLARRQERELRAWLYGVSGPARADPGPSGAAGSGDPAVPPVPSTPESFATTLARAAGDIEDGHAVTVAPVVVGDAELDDATAALVAAAREAMVNAAKHAGVDEISVYAEVEPETVSVFVRDRGCGFDPDAVAPDRHGLADSVRARTERHGGTVRVRTAPGEGTEIGLTMPRAPAARVRPDPAPSDPAPDPAPPVRSEP